MRKDNKSFLFFTSKNDFNVIKLNRIQRGVYI